MFKFIGKALAGLVLTKGAQRAVGRIGKGGTNRQTTVSAAARQRAMATAEARASDLVTADRAELIRQAMKVRAAKQTILAELDDETRGRLVATAMRAFLNEGRKKE
jgi:hypothetical protein